MEFRAKSFALPLGSRTYIMGIVNITPDSFCAESRFSGEAAAQRALVLEVLGADIVDFGAQSTAPVSSPISAREELSRLLPALTALNGRQKKPLSVDTFNFSVAKAAIENGADIVNFTGGEPTQELFSLVKKHSAGLILMHTGGGTAKDEIAYPNGVLADISLYFEKCLSLAEQNGVPLEQICLDPGIGFGKSREDDLEILGGIEKIKMPCALLVGASHKRVVRLAGGDAVSATLAAHSAAQLGGADILRVHDVAQSRSAADIIDIIKRKRGGENG